MKTLVPTVLVAIACCATPSLAQGPPTDESIAARMNRLEAETDALRAQLQQLKQEPIRLPGVEATPASMSDMSNTEMAPEGDVEYYTLPQLKAEMKKLVWTKGDFKIVPYGWLWGNMVYSTERTAPGSFTLFVQSTSTQGESEFVTDVRNTRLGFDVTGPRIPFFNCAESGGKVEVDFQQNVLSTENKSSILLRHAYWEVKDEDFRLLVGQTWDVVSPLNPGMLMYSVGWDGGNIGYRRAQFRGERYLAFSDECLLTLQLSANQTVFEDLNAKFAGEAPTWPIMEMRTATTMGDRKGKRAITFGVSGHIGEEQTDVLTGVPLVVTLKNVRRPTWSVGADLRVPITERFGVQGEFFTGSNLGAFLGGVGQGIDLTTFNPIRSNTGWCEVWYDFTPRFHTHVGYGIDDPNNDDISTVGERTYNSFYFGNLVYDITKNFVAGLEVSSWKTLYYGLAPGDAVRTEFVMKYGF